MQQVQKKLQFLTCLSLQIDLITFKKFEYLLENASSGGRYKLSHRKNPPNYLCTQKHANIGERMLEVYCAFIYITFFEASEKKIFFF